MNEVLYEVCVDSPSGARTAEDAGAGRVELCAGLVEGGTTPSAGAMRQARAEVGLPIVALIRPRAGDFLYDDAELSVMEDDVSLARELGLSGVAVGVLCPDGSVDRARTARLVEAAGPLAVTFHRAFDLTRDLEESLEVLADLGVSRVLTSGGAPTAVDGLERVSALVTRAGDRLTVVAAGGIRAESVARLVAATAVREVHGSAFRREESAMAHRIEDVPLGARSVPGEYERRRTDGRLVGAVVDALSGRRR